MGPRIVCAKCNVPVEVLDKRTEYSSKFALDVGGVYTYYVNCHGRVERLTLTGMHNTLHTYKAFDGVDS